VVKRQAKQVVVHSRKQASGRTGMHSCGTRNLGGKGRGKAEGKLWGMAGALSSFASMIVYSHQKKKKTTMVSGKPARKKGYRNRLGSVIGVKWQTIIGAFAKDERKIINQSFRTRG